MPVRSRRNAEHYTWGGACDGWRLLSRDNLSVIEERVPPGQGEVRHFHRRARHLFYVLSGRLRIELPSGAVAIGAGESLEIASRAIHRVLHPFDADTVFLVISSPSTAGDRTNV